MDVLMTALYARGMMQLRCNNPDLQDIEDVGAYVNMGSIADKTSNTHLLTADTNYFLGKAFCHFNWMTDDRMGLAPDEVNLTARFNNSHASMSVGDIVILQYSRWDEHELDYTLVTRYFECAPVGWNEIEGY